MTTPSHERHDRQLQKYGIDQDTYDQMWEACDGHCPVCTKPFSTNRLACIDHDHLTGRVRGLLCTACNYWLGELHDDADKLRRAADYLTKAKLSPHVWGFVPGSPGAPRD